MTVENATNETAATTETAAIEQNETQQQQEQNIKETDDNAVVVVDDDVNADFNTWNGKKVQSTFSATFSPTYYLAGKKENEQNNYK
jgi:hypothetical protein